MIVMRKLQHKDKFSEEIWYSEANLIDLILLMFNLIIILKDFFFLF